MASLQEQYRPRTLDDVAGQPKAVDAIRRVIARSWGGRAYWITGMSGTGKTTLARIIAEIGAEEWAIEELDAQWLTPTRIRELETGMQYRAMGAKPGKVYIVNEAHGMSSKAVTQLLTVLDPLPAHVVVIFTTTLTGASLFEAECIDSSPLISRCIPLALECNDDTKTAMARRAKMIAQKEGIDGLPDEIYTEAIWAVKGNMRSLLQRIETGQFRDDARAALKRSYEAVRATKGSYGEQQRKRIETLLKALES